MKKSIGFLVSIVVPAFIMAGVGANEAMAQEKAKAAPPKFERKVLVENDKVLVFEARWKPGGETSSNVRPFRIVRALKGGTLQRIYSDGKKELGPYKTGEVKVFEPDKAPYLVKNIGKSEMVLFVVYLK